MTDPRSMRSGSEILRDLDDAAKGVQAASTELSRLITKFGEASIDGDGQMELGVQLRYETALRQELVHIYQHPDPERRPPATDVREAMAITAVEIKDPVLYAEYHNTQSRIEGLKLWLSSQKATISAYQSLRRAES